MGKGSFLGKCQAFTEALGTSRKVMEDRNGPAAGAALFHGGSPIWGEIIWASSIGNGKWETFEKLSTGK